MAKASGPLPLGSSRLATVHSIGLYELPASLKEFIRRYPEVQIHIEYKMSDQVYHAVVEREYVERRNHHGEQMFIPRS